MGHSTKAEANALCTTSECDTTYGQLYIYNEERCDVGLLGSRTPRAPAWPRTPSRVCTPSHASCIATVFIIIARQKLDEQHLKYEKT